MVERIQYHLADWITGTEEMPFEVEAAYRKMCDYYYLTDGNLKDDDKLNSRRLKVSVRAYKKYKSELISMGKFQVVDGFLKQERAEKELLNVFEVSLKAKLKAAKRWRKTPEISANPLETIDVWNAAGDAIRDAAEYAISLTRKLDKKKEKINQKEIRKEFEESFWPPWPHKVDKAAALTVFIRVRSQGTALQTLTDAIPRYIASKPDWQDFMGPAKWLRNQRWEDSPGTAPVSATPKADRKARIAEFDKRMAEQGLLT